MRSGIGPALGSAAMKTAYFGNRQSNTVLIQMVDARDLSLMEREFDLIRSRTKERDFLFAAAQVHDWNRDLSPWPAPAVFGKNGFGDGADATLREILSLCGDRDKTYCVGGYSLAALFALWAGSRSDAFFAVAAASPSLWFPGFTDYLTAHPVRCERVYLSLGDREEKTKNPVMATVGERTRQTAALLRGQGVDCLLEWNQGSHFQNADIRTAKAFAWTLQGAPREKKQSVSPTADRA